MSAQTFCTTAAFSDSAYFFIVTNPQGINTGEAGRSGSASSSPQGTPNPSPLPTNLLPVCAPVAPYSSAAISGATSITPIPGAVVRPACGGANGGPLSFDSLRPGAMRKTGDHWFTSAVARIELSFWRPPLLGAQMCNFALIIAGFRAKSASRKFGDRYFEPSR